MKILPVMDPSFREYGQVLTGYDLKPLLAELERVTPQSATGTEYVPCQKELMELPVAKEIADGAFGGMPIQIGWCNGYNTMLNCLEYHRDSELNVGTEDFILQLNAQRMADQLGVSFTALINRLRELRLLDCRPMEEYIEKNLRFGGSL